MCALYESPDESRGSRVVPRALGSSLGDGPLCFAGVVVGGRAQRAVPLCDDNFDCRGEVFSPV